MREIIVNIKDILQIGKGCPIVIQTMCNCDTNDIDTAVSQCTDLSQAGAQMIRLTTQGLKEVESLKRIKNILKEKGINTPLVADVHFSSKVAIAAAKVADKVRINPGNFAKDHNTASSDFKEFIAVCKEHQTAVRIGINHGSLGSRITELYGNTPKGMNEAIKEWVNMCIEQDFYNVVLSLKASNTLVMVEAYRLLYKWMKKTQNIFPLHLGVTEAGNGDMGRIKSAVGLATLLSEGIGNTIRVSLTEPPISELPVAKLIANFFSDYKKPSTTIKTSFNYSCDTHQEFIINASCEIGPLLIDKRIDHFFISGTCGGKEIESCIIEDFKSDIMQAARRRFDKCEYIACPGCGRTTYDLEGTFNEVKKRTSHLKGLNIAVMGCIVNGPGEMADADWGYVGEGKGKVAIYKGKEAIMRSVPQDQAIDILLELIENEKQIIKITKP